MASEYPPPGIEIGPLLKAFWALYIAVADDHSGKHYEGECPICNAVSGVQELLPEGDSNAGR